MKNHLSIAIDGPSGAGKSTMAKRLAEELGFVYLDTGAIYRAVGLHVARKGADPTDSAAVRPLLPEIDISIRYIGGVQHIYLANEDVSQQIRTEQASKYASDVSAIPVVRAFLLDFQRSFALSNNVVMDGRDIGTVVLPKADLKIFLDASSEARAKRRYLEQIGKGMQVSFDAVYQALIQRDHNDSSRAAAPLSVAEDAIVLDTTELDEEASYVELRELVKQHLDI